MIGNKKLIGVCLTRVQSIAATEYLSRLHKRAMSQGYKLIVFNSPVDFYNNDSGDAGAETVYRLINFDMIDALVIHGESFVNKSVYEKIIYEAESRGVPVILLKDTHDGCRCIVNDYEDAFKAVIGHVIRDHGVKDTFFIAGRREQDPASELRIRYYKEAMEENGLTFSEELVDYGDYWDVPTIQAVRRLLKKRGTPPRAIFCANDFMAIAACEELKRQGFRVPEDVIVTGFDGVPEADYRVPQLTTCKEDFDSMADHTVALLDRLFKGEETEHMTVSSYRASFTESCGCPYSGQEPRQEAQKQFTLMHDAIEHDDFVFGWIGTAMEAKDINAFMARLPETVLSLGYVCLNDGLISRITEDRQMDGDFPYTDELDIVNSKYSPDPVKRKRISRSRLIPGIEDWANDERDTVCVVSTIHSGDRVFGYYTVRTDDFYLDANRINRTLNGLNIAFNAIVGYYRQRVMLLGLRNASFTDHLTGLGNLKGTTMWFNKFASNPKNHQLTLTISVYGLPKYKYIYENYGIDEIEESIRFVAETLRSSNSEEAFIGHVADDEFLVINYYDSPDQIADTINDATTKFFTAMNNFNASGKKEYYLEVNAGCAEFYPGWEGTLEAFSKLAGNEMYLNRMNRNTEQAVTNAKLPAEIYKSFELLIDKNLFDYHFQPIVDAKTGEIIAYEALMRPDKSVNMNPGQVIQTAVEYDRLDDVEKATMFNVMKRFADDPTSFRGRKIFVNSIPGHFLHGKEYDRLLRQYEQYLDNIVVEITEGSSVSDEELKLIRGINRGTLPIAIDDYGSGHSNIVNLLRYSPQIIKIDRFLISDIHKDTNKQLFFRSTVEFAALNGIKVLAEGVETAEELKCVIELGADLIQGFYTGRPAFEPIDEISADIKEFMLLVNKDRNA